jgi:hypothetical protein
MHVFTPLTLSQTEQDIIRDKLSDPTIQKYLQFIAQGIAVHILTADPGTSTAEEHLRKVAKAQGQLECLEALASAFSSTSQS